MTKPATRLASIATGLALGLLPCSAQESGKASLRFLSFPKSREPVKIELRLAADATIEIEAPSNELSRPMSVASAGVWVVGETVDGPEGKPVFKEYGRTKAPASPDQILLLVRKGAENADGFDLIALDGRRDGFGGGKFLFINVAKVDIAGTVGEEKFVVRPGQHKILKPRAKAGERSAHAMFYFRKGDEPRPFFSSRWPVAPHARCMIFFYHDPASSRLLMHTIRDYL